MNDNIDLTKILKDCPKGWKLYSPILGEVDFLKIRNDLYAIVTIQDFHTTSFTKEGFYYADVDGECILFPSKDQRDWSKFTAPWYKKEDTIECLEEQSKEEYVLKSSKDEDIRKFMQYIEKQAKAYDLNLPNRSYDIYAFAKDLLTWLDKKGEQEEPQVYETEDGEIITYPGTDRNKFVEPNFHEGDWVVNKFGDSWHIDSIDKKNYQVSDGKGNYNYFPISKQDEMHLWTIKDAKTGDVLVNGSNILIFHLINNRRLMGYCHVNMDDGNSYNDIGRNECFCTIDAPVTPATKEQRDALRKVMNNAGYEWNDKTKTLEKLIKPKFDPKTLNLFDKVLVKMSNESFNTWYGNFVAEPSHAKNETPLIVGAKEANMVIPYNEETKHLLGTSEEAPEYYRYWED